MRTIRPLTTLVNNREAGGYTLPDELLEAFATHERISTTAWPEVRHLDVEAAAARFVAGAELDTIAREVVESDRARAVEERGRQVLRAASERATESAGMVAHQLTEHIITEHLRPAHEAVLDEVRTVAAVLDGHALNAHALLSAPSKVRNAYLQLPALVARHTAVLEARKLANAIGDRRPQHDTAHLFSSFEKPMSFFPGQRSPVGARLPFPEDPTESLLWRVTDPQAIEAKPWLPTTAEQDAAWWAQFGENAPKPVPWNRVVTNA